MDCHPPSSSHSSETAADGPAWIREKNASAQPPHTFSNDDAQLVRLGKKPVLQRSFGFMSILGLSCTVLITWEGAVVGGPAGVLWGFLICWIGTFSVFAVLAELTSLAPVSSGQYHWISILSPPCAAKFLSYITGWVTVLGWQAFTVSSAFLVATIIQGVAALVHPDYTPTNWQAMLITWALLAFAIIINAVSSRALATFEGMILILHLFGFFGVLIPIVYLGPHGDASVFTTLYDGGDWGSPGFSFVVGLPSLIFCLFGADSAVHMAEEIQTASIAVPQALMLTVTINGALGFAMLLALMFCMGDMTAALDAIDTLGFAFLEIFAQAVESRAGAAAMASVVIIMGACSLVGVMAASTRLLWAFARDKGVPFSGALVKLHRRSMLPLYTLLTTIAISVLLSLIALGSSVALNDVLSLVIAGLYSSYLISCSMLCYRRIQGKIGEYDSLVTITGPDTLQWGPWRIREPFGTINNAFACLYLLWMLFWSFWPPSFNPSVSSFNFSAVVFSAVLIFSVLWYVVKARKYFKGPINEVP